MADWIPELERLDAYWGEVDTSWAPLFTEPPDLLVIHSGSLANWVAEFLSNPTCGPPDGHVCADGVRRRVAAAHISYYEGRLDKLRPGVVAPKVDHCFVQQASLLRSVPGAGGSVCQGRGKVNARSLHIELPAAPRSVSEVRGQFSVVLALLTERDCPSLRYWTTHREADPKNRRDPVAGTGWSSAWMQGSGLIWASRR